MDGLRKTLNQFFAPQRAAKSKPGSYVAIRGDVRAIITRDGQGVWSCEIGGRHFSSVLLRELKAQLRELGFDLLKARP